MGKAKESMPRHRTAAGPPANTYALNEGKKSGSIASVRIPGNGPIASLAKTKEQQGGNLHVAKPGGSTCHCPAGTDFSRTLFKARL